jgi:hypothetical protein
MKQALEQLNQNGDALRIILLNKTVTLYASSR